MGQWSRRTEDLPQWQKIAILSVALIFVAGLFVRLFYSLEPTGRLAYDRRILHDAMQHWTYGSGMSNPPWSMALVYPFEQLPLQLTWAMLAYILLIALVLWIPVYTGWPRYILLFILPISWITLRNYAEGNYEAFVLIGLFCIWTGLDRHNGLLLAFGLLLGTIKPQLVVLLMLMLPWYVRGWSLSELWRVAVLVGAVVIPALLYKGQEWLDSLDYFSSDRGVRNLWAVDVPAVVSTVFRAFVIAVSLYGGLVRTRISFALLISGSLLIAPYAGVLSLVTIMGVSVGAVFAAHWWLIGFVMVIAYQDVPTLTGNQFEGYWLLVLLFTWIVLVAVRLRELQDPAAKPSTLASQVA